MTINDVHTSNWQLSLQAQGELVQGVEDVLQCVDIILKTPKGSDPLRPLFGSDVYLHIDKPLNIAIPNTKKEIVESLGIWETRATVSSVTHETPESGSVKYNIYLQIGNDIFSTYIRTNGTGIVSKSQPYVVQAAIPVL